MESITDSEVWRNILLKLEPEDVQQLCSTNIQLSKICQDSSFYREYLTMRDKPVPPSLNLSQVYFDYYLQAKRVQKILERLKYQVYFRGDEPDNWTIGVTITSDNIIDHVDFSLFEGINGNEVIPPYLEKIKQLDREMSMATINMYPKYRNVQHIDDYSLELTNDNDETIVVNGISEEQFKIWLGRCLKRGINLVTIEGDEIEFPA